MKFAPRRTHRKRFAPSPKGSELTAQAVNPSGRSSLRIILALYAMLALGIHDFLGKTVLKKIDLSPGGLIIEDFNTAFQIHKKKLGKVYYHPEIWAYGNEPSTINDYIAQVNRWNLGFWQTLFKHKIWASFFSLATVSFVIESLFIALFLYMLPLTAFVLIIKYFPDMFSASLLSISESLNKFITPALLFTAVIFLDFIYTVIVAIIIRKPVLLFYGPGFIFFRFLDSLIILSSLFQAIFTKSDGVWTSPKRKRL